VDGVTWKEYGEHLEKNLRDLVARMKAKRYRPQPAKRVYIPKDEHSRRPLGLPALEDKIVQKGIAEILSAIYEADFLDCSYGFRPGRIKRQVRGVCSLARYADDFVCMVQHETDAQYILQAIRERFAQFELALHPEKTRVISFGRNERRNARREQRRPNTFDFLGFTHYCERSRWGRYMVGRKTSGKKFRRKCRELNEWLKAVRNRCPVKEWWPVLKAKLQGHYQYYGISGNTRTLRKYYCFVVRMAWKWLNRRSQRCSFTWEQFWTYLNRYPLPEPRIVHKLYTLWPVK
jgi:hypothetical protein